MARVSRAKPSKQGEPEEYKVNAKRARAAREDAGDQVRWAISHADLTGSPEYVARRVREWLEAEREGDPFVTRAALLEIAAAAGAYIVHLDLTAPALRASAAPSRVGSEAS